MAALSSNRLYDLIERIFVPHRNAEPAVFDIVKVKYRALDSLTRTQVPRSGRIDEEWLGRRELRGATAVIQFLESYPSPHAGKTRALFVDDRCGLIQEQVTDPAQFIEPAQAAAVLLRSASQCHASAVVLATHRLGETRSEEAWCRALAIDLYHKGDALGIFLLDHFVLTPGGWKHWFSVRAENRP